MFRLEAFRQFDGRDGMVFEADDGTTMQTMEMNMHVVVFLVVETATKFKAGVFCVFQDMHEMVILEERQRTGNARLVDTAYPILKLAHGEGLVGVRQGFGHKDTVGRWPHVMLLH